MDCPTCMNKIEIYDAVDYEVAVINFWWCRTCGTIARQIDGEEINSSDFDAPESANYF